jgi:hypothetical protein
VLFESGAGFAAAGAFDEQRAGLACSFDLTLEEPRTPWRAGPRPPYVTLHWPETALLRNLTDPKGFWLYEQNFDFDLLSPQKLLEKYVGEKVTVLGNRNGQETREEATVLATNGGVVLQFADRIETSIPGRLVYPRVPGNLRARPTLVMSLHSPAERAQSARSFFM